MPGSGIIDEKIKQELRSLEGTYNEADWQLLEPYVNTLEPPSAFSMNKKAVLLIILCFALGTGLYFAIPLIKKIQEQKKESLPADTLVTDTASADPNFSPDTTPEPAPVVIPPVTPAIDSAAFKAREDSLKASQTTQVKETPAEKISEKPASEPKPKKKKKKQPAKTDSVQSPDANESEDLLRKDVPIIAVPDEPPPSPEKKGPEELPKP